MVSNKRFVKKWVEAFNTGRSVRDVAKALGLTKQQASARAHKLRKLGVELPALVRAQELNVDELNAIVRELKNED